MSQLLFYREQAAQQQGEADAATLDNVRDRCQRAADAWSALANRSERTNVGRNAAALQVDDVDAIEDGSPVIASTGN